MGSPYSEAVHAVEFAVGSDEVSGHSEHCVVPQAWEEWAVRCGPGVVDVFPHGFYRAGPAVCAAYDEVCAEALPVGLGLFDVDGHAVGFGWLPGAQLSARPPEGYVARA